MRCLLLLLLASPVAALPSAPSLRGSFEQSPGGVGTTSVTALGDNAQAWAARWRAIAQAQHTIDASYFIVTNDVFGLAFLAQLYERAQHGVDVRLLLDGRGSAPLTLPFAGLDVLQELVGTGNAEVRVYNPPLLQVARTALELSAVPVSAGTHNKILAVDDRVAITGGRNIAAVYFASRQEDPSAVVDFDVEVTGAAAAALADVVQGEHSRWYEERIRRDVVNFVSRHETLLMVHAAMDAWLHGRVVVTPFADAVAALEAAGAAAIPAPTPDARAALREFAIALVALRSIHGTLYAPVAEGQVAEAHVIGSQGRAEEHDDRANDAIIRSIATAQRRVWIQSPYFMMTPRLLGALERAADRGVDIIALTNGPASSDNEPAQALFIDTWPELQARIRTLRVFAGAGPMLHVKRVIVDDTLTLIGSHNLDPLSANLNSEVVVALWSRAFNAQAAADISRMLDGGEVYEYRTRRGPDGRVVRDDEGAVIVTFGPRNHLTARRLEELRSLKRFLLSVRGIWDLEFIAW